MPLKILPGKKVVIGVDIGTSAVKILELKVSGGKISVARFGQENLDHGLDEKSPQEKQEAYAAALKKALDSGKFSTKNAAVSISGNSVIVRFVKFPKMSAEELKNSLQFEAEQHIPFDISEVYMDTQIIRDLEENSQTKMETVLVAGKKETVQSKLEIVEQSGLIPAVVDVDAFAVENAYEAFNADAAGQVIMIVNIGASTTNISIIDKGTAKVVRDLNIAGNSFSRAVQSSMGADTAKAEELKKKYGLSGSGAEENEDGEDIGAQLFEALYPAVKELISELQRSVDFFTGQNSSENIIIEKIVLSGGSASLKGLPEMINTDISLPVEVFSPFTEAELKTKSGAALSSLGVVTGLALRKIGDHI